MQTRHYLLATAGHVDHGKSALVKALTGTDPDRLPEEKARGITIDLGFAHLDLPAPAQTDANAAVPLSRPAAGSGNPRMSVGIVDVPGHEDFVKNMVAGVGSTDVALLVVAADDGWMPQTEEHLQILSYLGVARAVVALTKADLIPGCERAAIDAIRERLQTSPFFEAPIVPASVVTPNGVDALKAVLAAVLAETPPPADIGKPRLPVDRVFVLKGIGTVITGSLGGGALARGQEVVLQPAGVATRIRSLQTFHAEVESAGPGMRVAVNLADVEPRSETQPRGVERGEVLTLGALGVPSATLDVVIAKSARLSGHSVPAARPLKDRTRVRVHLGSANVAATVFLHRTAELVAGATALAQLRLEGPAFAFLGDRFIVRDWSEQATLAGGTVLDPDGDRKFWQAHRQLTLLEGRAAAADDPLTALRSQLERDRVVRREAVLRKARFSDAQVARALDALVREGRAVALGDLVADGAWWRGVLTRAAERVDLEHHVRPERVGIPLSELRSFVADELTAPGGFDALVTALIATGFQQVGSHLKRAAHQPALPAKLEAAGRFLRQFLNEKPLEPPSRKELAPDPEVRQALRFLLDTGQAVEIGPEIVMSADAYAEAVRRVKAFLAERGRATLSELRQAVGTSRRIMVPLAERLDREGVTTRAGDLRSLGRNG